MSLTLLTLVTLAYLWCAVELSIKGDWMGLVFAGYFAANIGLIFSLK